VKVSKPHQFVFALLLYCLCHPTVSAEALCFRGVFTTSVSLGRSF